MAAQAYLFTGPEFGAKGDKIDSIKADLKKRLGDVEFSTCYVSENPVSEVVSTLQSGSLFSASSCVVYREAELIKKKDDVGALSEWLASASDSQNVLILVSDEISVDKKLEEIVPKQNRQIFWEISEDRKNAWIRDFFSKNGFGIEDDAVSLILDMVEGDTLSLRTECSRFLYCFRPGATITAGDVENILSHNREENAFTLFDAMVETGLSAEKRLENSLSIVQKIMMTKNSSPVPLIAGLASCFRKLGLWHSLHSGPVSEAVLKKNGFLSKKAIAQYERAARIWSFAQASSITARLSAFDVEIRSAGSAFQNTLLFMLVYEMVMKNGSPCSKYVADF
ncbi:DNA polymerase III subunit delta [Treponema saccharophilum]|uniref:DNA-directed DNA polymerase n=1 Tax=Treponema saccharophilum DSM 2985 TaxID=907348 RepID=H7EHN3_9SPIR|nr:DNA polymerase III subunit delta [Treponema saccharophilum]EIC02909.1 DNA polymerase III, delta subunit [Treponema saccharophilum DSM 2985]BDC96746.1 DNA polymerase III subunit delta [Treponema saccharophilum]